MRLAGLPEGDGAVLGDAGRQHALGEEPSDLADLSGILEAVQDRDVVDAQPRVVDRMRPGQRDRGAARGDEVRDPPADQGAVDEAVDASGEEAAELGGEVVARDDRRGAGGAQHGGVGLAGVGDHADAGPAGEADRIAAEHSGAAGDEQALAGAQAGELEGEERGQRVHRHRGGSDEVGAFGERRDGGCGDRHQLRVGAAGRAARVDDADHPPARRERDARADALDGAGELHAADVGRREVRHQRRLGAAAHHQVGGVQRRSGDPDDDASGCGDRIGKLGDLQDVGRAEGVEGDGEHAANPASRARRRAGRDRREADGRRRDRCGRGTGGGRRS